MVLYFDDTILFGGTVPLTTHPALITLLSPNTDPLSIATLMPIHTLLPIIISLGLSLPFVLS